MEVTLAASSEGAISAFVNAFLGVRGVFVNGSFLAQFPLLQTPEGLPTTLRAIYCVSFSVLSPLFPTQTVVFEDEGKSRQTK